MTVFKVPWLPATLSLLLFFAFCNPGIAQDYSYTQYSIQNGLAGSNVYNMTQDTDGFIWFATETGLSRFDGHQFKNFTVADGLPSNEIFGVFADSKNRIWMMCFQKAICYYQNGKIHNQDNDSVLKKIKIRASVSGYSENAEGDILVRVSVEDLDLIENYIIKGDSVTATILDKTGHGYQKKNVFSAIRGTGAIPERITDIPENIRIQLRKNNMPNVEPSTISSITGRKYLTAHVENIGASSEKRILVFAGNDTVGQIVNSPVKTNFISYINDHTLALVRSQGGVTLFDLDKMSITENIFSKLNIVFVMEDKEQNLWLATKGLGVFKIGPAKIRNFSFNNLAVRDIKKINGHIYIGTNDAKLWSLNPLNFTPYKFNTGGSPRRVNGAWIFTSVRNSRQNLYFTTSSSNYLALTGRAACGSVKTLQLFGDTFFAASSNIAYTMKLPQLKLIDTIYSGRSNCAYYSHGIYYVGTLDGLYIRGQDKRTRFTGDKYPILKSRINAIAEGRNGVIWLATNGNGIVGYKDGRIILGVNKNDGLTSGICRTICAEGDNLWIGTDKGLSKATIRGNTLVVTQNITETDGLNSDMVNSILYDSGTLYVGTELGLSVFDAASLPTHGISNIVLTDVQVSRNHLNPHIANIHLKHADNNIRFDFSGISFLSGGYITYKYRLLGLSDTWAVTTEHSLSYPSLPSGQYQFQIIAINKFGDKSHTVTYKFEIDKLLWEHRWVQLLAIFGIVLITSIIVRYIVRRTNSIEKEKLRSAQKILELEQMALRAQMNPHFVFNSLNSLQQYILNKDVRSANSYLSRFAGLVRQTLENATRLNIPLSEEIRYLETYIELERMQLLDPFTYTLNVDDRINRELLLIPNMVLQPYVENAIKHGVLQMQSKGHISIAFTLIDENILNCTIRDNGIGIVATTQQKDMHNSRQSYGLSINDKRIITLNQLNGKDKKISVHIVDLNQFEDNITGTSVTINFPIILKQ